MCSRPLVVFAILAAFILVTGACGDETAGGGSSPGATAAGATGAAAAGGADSTGGQGGAGGSSATGGGGVGGTGGGAGGAPSGAGGGACAPDAADDVCIACMKSMCCPEHTACAGDASCTCWFECRKSGSNYNKCFGDCGGPPSVIAANELVCGQGKCPACGLE